MGKIILLIFNWIAAFTFYIVFLGLFNKVIIYLELNKKPEVFVYLLWVGAGIIAWYPIVFLLNGGKIKS